MFANSQYRAHLLRNPPSDALLCCGNRDQTSALKFLIADQAVLANLRVPPIGVQ